jgi:RNA polymerase sigma-70 factor (ECF subfamily)
MNNQKTILDDSQLVGQYINGNEAAFEELVNRHKSRIFTTIHMIVKDQYVAEDLLQEVFIKAIRTLKSGRYNEEGKFLPWILRIAHNLAIDRFRKNKRYPVIVMDDGNSVFETLEFAQGTFEDEQMKKDVHKSLRKLIQELPEAQKQVLIMRHYMDMSFKEISDQTGVSINTALGRMRYALINLRKKMQLYNITYDQNFYS